VTKRSASTSNESDVLVHQAVLHALRVAGFAPAAHLSEVTGHDHPTVERLLRELEARSLAAERSGRLAGWLLTDDGKAEHAVLVAAELERSGARPVVEAGYGRFLKLNEDFKALCTSWQLRPAGSGHVPNDHADATYDEHVILRVQKFHGHVEAVCDQLGQGLERYGRYQPRFAGALDRLCQGDQTALTRPLSGSYHDVWMELHQDLLVTLGRERTEADGT
jgi:hypothetical protein